MQKPRISPTLRSQSERELYGTAGFGHRSSTAVTRSTIRALAGLNANNLWFMHQNMLYRLPARTDRWKLRMADLEPRLLRQIRFKQFILPL